MLVPYAPLLKKEKLGKALILNGIRAFYLFEVKRDIAFLRSMSGLLNIRLYQIHKELVCREALINRKTK